MFALENHYRINWLQLDEGPCENIFRFISEENVEDFANVRLVCRKWRQISYQCITVLKFSHLEVQSLRSFTRLCKIELECFSHFRLPVNSGAMLCTLSPLIELAITGLRKHELNHLFALAHRTDLIYFRVGLIERPHDCVEFQELGNLPSITHFERQSLFYVNQNKEYQLEGNQLRHLEALTNLQSLTLRYIKNIGADDLNWIGASSITKIAFDRCSFDFKHSRNLEFSSSIKKLEFECCHISPDFFKIDYNSLRNLKSLSFDDSYNSFEVSEQLSNLNQLERVSYGGNRDNCRVVNRILNLTNLSNLKEINLVSDVQHFPENLLDRFSAFSQLTRIEVANLYEGSIDEVDFASWNCCETLRCLILSCAHKFTPESTRYFTRFTNLQVLNLSEGDDQHIDRDTLSRLQNLRELTFYNVAIDDEDFDGVATLTNLEVLNLELNYNLSDRSLQSISHLHQLRKLTVGFFDGFDGDFTRYSNEQFSAQSLRQWTALQKLNWLSFINCRFLTGSSLKMITTLRALQKLDLEGCISLERGSFAVLSSLKMLRILKLAGTKIGNEELTGYSNLVRLRSLNLSSCQNITKQFVQKIYPLSHLDDLELTDTAEGYIDSDQEV